MFFFIVGNSWQTLALSASASLLFWLGQASPSPMLVSTLSMACFAIFLAGHITSVNSLSNLPRALWQSLFEQWGHDLVAPAPVDVRPRLKALPVEAWRPASSLAIGTLRQRLARLGGAAADAPLERAELEKAYTEAFEPTCAICQEDYCEGDECRLLWPRCRHGYHRRCFDTWALAQGAKGRHPACPVCQAPI